MCLCHAVSWAQVSVLTQHNDNARTGANLNEVSLTTSNVNVSTFGTLFSMPVDGFVFAQPLYMPNLNLPGSGTHNVLFVATAHDSVYAFDADTGAQLWQKSLGTPVPQSVVSNSNILIEVGIISTPVIDPSTKTLYVVAKTYENSVQIFRLHALDILNAPGGYLVLVLAKRAVVDNGVVRVVVHVHHRPEVHVDADKLVGVCVAHARRGDAEERNDIVDSSLAGSRDLHQRRLGFVLPRRRPRPQAGVQGCTRAQARRSVASC